jgi:hypothetical protein
MKRDSIVRALRRGRRFWALRASLSTRQREPFRETRIEWLRSLRPLGTPSQDNSIAAIEAQTTLAGGSCMPNVDTSCAVEMTATDVRDSDFNRYTSSAYASAPAARASNDAATRALHPKTA